MLSLLGEESLSMLGDERKRGMKPGDVVGIPPKCHVYNVVYYDGNRYAEHQVVAERVVNDFGLAFYIGKRVVAAFREWISALEVTK
jgi:hypothetical protein